MVLKLALRAAVVMPISTLTLCYAIARPSWPTIHPSAVFDNGVTRVVATLGFSLSAPCLALFGVMRFVRDQNAGDGQRIRLRANVFAGVVVGLLCVASVPWHVSHIAHTAAAVLFFVSASCDLVLQHTAQCRRRQSSQSHCTLGATRLFGVCLCLLSVAGQLTQYRPAMGVGEVGFACVYLCVLAAEEQELERISVRLTTASDGLDGQLHSPMQRPL